MGNALAGAGRAAARTSGRRLESMTEQDLAAITRLVEQDQSRLKHLPSLEELGAKDSTLDELLVKLNTSVVRKELGASQDALQSTQQQSAGIPMPPARPSTALMQPHKKRNVEVDDEPGRVQSYVLKDLFTQRATLGQEAFLREQQHVVQTFKVDEAKLLKLFEYNCLPDVGKVATFGHQYAFARAPHWFRRDKQTYARFISEPGPGPEGRAREAPVTAPQAVLAAELPQH